MAATLASYQLSFTSRTGLSAAAALQWLSLLAQTALCAVAVAVMMHWNRHGHQLFAVFHDVENTDLQIPVFLWGCLVACGIALVGALQLA